MVPKMKKAQKNTEEILYAYQQEGNQLSLDPMWKVQTSTRFQKSIGSITTVFKRRTSC